MGEKYAKHELFSLRVGPNLTIDESEIVKFQAIISVSKKYLSLIFLNDISHP